MDICFQCAEVKTDEQLSAELGDRELYPISRCCSCSKLYFYDEAGKGVML